MKHLNENMTFFTRATSGSVRDGLVVGIHKILETVEKAVTGDTTHSEAFYMPSNAENNRDFFNALDRMSPYYDAALIYSTAKGLPP